MIKVIYKLLQTEAQKEVIDGLYKVGYSGIYTRNVNYIKTGEKE